MSSLSADADEKTAQPVRLSTFFIEVRADALAATGGKRRTFEDSSLTEVGLTFRAAAK